MAVLLDYRKALCVNLLSPQQNYKLLENGAGKPNLSQLTFRWSAVLFHSVTVILTARYTHHKESRSSQQFKKKKELGNHTYRFVCVSVIELSKEFRLNQRKHITFQCKIFSYYITWIFDKSRYKRELINGIVLLRLSFTKK